MKDWAAFFLLVRPLNVVIAGLSIALAAGLGAENLCCNAVMCAIVSGMFITAGANAINDICDLEIDRINKPRRMLPANRMSLRSAQIYTIILLACGVIFSIFVGIFAALIAVGSTFLIVAYSLRFKRQPLIGNVVVSLITAAAFIFGALAACTETPQWHTGIYPALFAFFFHFGREIVKDLEDQTGDKAVHARTLPLAYGPRAAQFAATLAFVILAFIMTIPARTGFYRQPYGLIILFGVYPVIIFAAWHVWRNPEVKHMRFISNLLKFDMFVGLAAIWFGSRS